MTKISATIVADSINEFGNRITSMLLVMPRMILPEFNTHRMFSRNSASSRAIPFKKMVEAVRTDPFVPIAWMKDHTGMQGREYLTQDQGFWCRETWLVARDYAVQQAILLNEKYGLTKQMCNRLLEPFMWTTVLCTATEWENFFALRYNDQAEIHMQALAQEMLTAMNASTPRKLQAGEWHVPFGDEINLNPNEAMADILKVAVARAARTSYTLPDAETKHDYAKDIELHDRLLKPGHMSPFEHCSQCQNNAEFYANFRGWKQYRHFIDGENKTDTRLLSK